ncbi:MAG: oligosaccharide repeat unit polymerase [Bacteroidales bacterium]|nr:oligosaccharide repeat unit polymerase [Bacteroidales bacterium]
MLTGNEWLYTILLAVGVIGIPIVQVFSKKYYAIFSPITMVCVVYFYYALLGPFNKMASGEVIVRTNDLREYFTPAMVGCLVSFYSLLLGYLSKKRFRGRAFALNFPVVTKQLRNIGFTIIAIALTLFTIFSGGDIVSRINFLDVAKTGQDFSGSFASYLMLSINFLVVGALLTFYYYYNRKVLLVFLFIFGLIVSLFINEAFRYRIVILILALFSAYHLYRQQKPNLVFMAATIIPFFLLMGILEIARVYGRGIDVTRIENVEYGDLAEKSLNETDVFWATGLFMDKVFEVADYTYFDFIVNAIASPIPRKIWPSKPDGSYILKTNDDLFGSTGKGQAYLNFSEYYLAFGWLGVVVVSFLWGYFFKTVWLWFLRYKEHPLAITAISVFNAFIYVIISRNYFTQHLTLFFFTVYPAFFVIWLYRKRFINPYFYVRRQHS